MNKEKTIISVEDFKKLLITMEYEALAITNPELYELANEEQQVEEYINQKTLSELKTIALDLNYQVQ